MNSLSRTHPITAAVYFLSVLLITMFTANPILLFFALTGSVAFSISLDGSKAFIKSLAFYLPMFIFIAVTNPLFSHNGATPLFFINGNPITLEAVLYGIDIAVMLVAVMYWFRCFNSIFTSDRLIFLLGRISPKLSLLVSSALRFVPLLKQQAAKIKQAQKAMGLFASDSWYDKLRSTLRVYSSLITWAFENAIDTGSSMNGRGYGMKGRSHFAVYRFSKSDGMLISLIVFSDIIIFSSMAMGKLDFTFYPRVSSFKPNAPTITAIISFALLSLLPFILEVKENIKWIYYKSKI